METLFDIDSSSSLLAAVRASKAAEEQAARDTLILAAKYAAANMVDAAGAPVAALQRVDDLDGVAGREVIEPLTGDGAPVLAEGAVIEFAHVLGYSDYTGKKYLADAVELRWRLPHLWSRILDGTLAVWRARQVAKYTRPLGPDAAAYVDKAMAPVAHKTGLAQIERTAIEAIALFEPDTAAALAEQADEQRKLDIHAGVSEVWTRPGTEHGQAVIPLAGVSGVLDVTDALDLEAAVASIAHGLLEHDATADWSLDMRRSAALGVLARAYNSGQMPEAPGSGRVLEIVVHTDTRDLADTGLVRIGNTRGLATMERLERWATTPGVTIKRTIVVDLTEEITTDAYVPTLRQRRQAELLHQHCAFPHCNRRAEVCDLDHRVPFRTDGKGGSTTTENLTPLCRKHHRAKTHMGWRYDRMAPAVYQWVSPHGYVHITGPDGTIDISPDLDIPIAQGEWTPFGYFAPTCNAQAA